MTSRLDTLVKSIVFPRPKPETFSASTHPDSLLHIPCVERRTLAENGLFTNGYLFRHHASTHLLIYAHPNAVDIGMLYDEMRHLSKHTPVDVLAFEYSGYGLTHRDITEPSMNDDMASAYCFARRYLSTPANRIILCGRSIGAATAAKLCAGLSAAETPSLLILQCPFTALSECIQEFSQNAVTLANILGYNWFRTVDLIADVRCPVVLHHGTHDTIVPIWHTYALRQKRDSAARPCVTYVYQEDGKGHNNLSRSVLIQIIQDKVDTQGLSLLQTACPSYLLARSPLYPHLFPPDSRKESLRAVHQRWQQHYNLERFLTSRDSLHVLLTASACSFAMKVAYAWQVYSEVVKRNARNMSPSVPSTPLHGNPPGSATWLSTMGYADSSGFSGSFGISNNNNNNALSNGGLRSASSTGRAPADSQQRVLRAGRDERRGVSAAVEDRRCTKDDFIERCIACWGSPLGIHVPVAGITHDADALLFGSYVPPGKCSTFDVGWQFSTRPPCPMVTVAELPMTPGLLRTIRKVVSSAPELLHNRSDSDDDEQRRRRRRQAPHACTRPAPSGHDLQVPLNPSTASSTTRHTDDGGSSGVNNSYDNYRADGSGDGSDDEHGGGGDGEKGMHLSALQAAKVALPAFIHPELVSAVQTECERIAGFLSDEDATNLQTLLEDFDAGCEERLSPKCRVTAGSSFREESFDELTEWLRPYMERPGEMEEFAAEVPWDYYLFKARVLADRTRLGVDMDWALCLRMVEESRIVALVYQLFRKYYLQRMRIPQDS